MPLGSKFCYIIETDSSVAKKKQQHQKSNPQSVLHNTESFDK